LARDCALVREALCKGVAGMWGDGGCWRGRRSARELVAEAVDGDDVRWRFRVGLDLLPQAGDVDVHGAREWHLVVSPYLGQQLVSRQRRAAMGDEMSQQLELARRQVDDFSAARHLRAAEVDHDLAEAVRATRCLDPRAPAPQQRLEP